MGLDMYAFKTKTVPDKQIDFEVDKKEEIAYWRKFNNLHGWMEKLYEKKGGTGEFNCVPVRLENEDLDKLEADTRDEKNLDPVEGFFFGHSDPLSKEDQEEIFEFIQDARKAITDGYVVFYDSWW
jgi:hypothetical protein